MRSVVRTCSEPLLTVVCASLSGLCLVGHSGFALPIWAFVGLHAHVHSPCPCDRLHVPLCFVRGRPGSDSGGPSVHVVVDSCCCCLDAP